MVEKILIGILAFIVFSGRWTFFDGFDIRILLLLTTPIVIVAFNKKRFILNERLAFSLLFSPYVVYVVIQMFFSNAKDFSLEKLIDCIFLFLLILNFSLILRFDRVSFFIKSSFYILVILQFLGVLGIIIAGGRSSIIGGGPNVYGRLMTILYFLSVSFPFGKMGLPIRLLSVVLLLMTGSRGSYIGFMTGIVSSMIMGAWNVVKIVVFTSLPIIIGFFIGYGYIQVVTDAVDKFRFRFIELTLERGYTSGRDWIYNAAYEVWRENPIFGLYPNALQSIEGRGYHAHNFFLEALSDHGVIGLLLLLLPLIYGSIYLVLHKKKMTLYSYIFAILSMAMMASSQFSGDVYDSRYIYVFLLLSISSLKEDRYSDMEKLPTR